ncbi:MAG: hypothetical protein M3Y39_10385 [Chloroflexota bacterium]|nr:hypothetical protein [Chloroflexota bacterium]
MGAQWFNAPPIGRDPFTASSDSSPRTWVRSNQGDEPLDDINKHNHCARVAVTRSLSRDQRIAPQAARHEFALF